MAKEANNDKADRTNPPLGSDKNDKSDRNTIRCDKVRKKRNFWPLKITVITFVLALLFSLIAEATSQNSNLTVAIILLAFLILLSIVFDSIGVAVTSCDIAPLNAMAAKKVPHAKKAIWLVKNAGRVNNICADVIGDICGIISGACGATVVLKIALITYATDKASFWISIVISSIIAALTVGGKAFMKSLAIKNSREFVMFTARILSVFSFKKKDKSLKNNDKSDKSQDNEADCNEAD